MTTTATRPAAAPKQKTSTIRVKREFRRPEVVAWLETVDEETLAALATEEEAFELTAEERARAEEGFAQIDAGKGIPHEEVEAWFKSLGTDNPLPKPTCK